MRIQIRTSRLATWARRLGAFAVPLLVLGLALRFLDIIDVESLEITLALASGVGLLAVLCAVLAYVRMWHTGDVGWKRATLGLLSGLLALTPLGYAAVFFLVYPSTDDITTAPLDPPALALRPDDETVQSLATGELARRFPGVIGRTYAVEPEALYALVEGLANVRGWAVVRRLGPTTRDGEGILNVLERTLLGWQNEIAFRVIPDARGARLDVRAAPVRDGWHDLGHNGEVVAAFLLDLAEAVAIYERNAELIDVPPTPDGAND